MTDNEKEKVTVDQLDLGDKIYNRAALGKLRSPEKLDALVRVTDPAGWLGLLSFCVLCFAIVLWSIFGSFTDKAEGYGLILDSAGIANIMPSQAGEIIALYVRTGDVVHKGQVIARMRQADTNAARHSVSLASNDRDAAGRVYDYDTKRIQEKERANIRSAYNGVVDEVMVTKGSSVAAGSPICAVRLTQKRDELTGVFYIPVDKGKRVKPGMMLQLAPNGVDVTQTGSLVGVVKSVSQYPISAEGVQKGLGNAQLAQYVLSQDGGSAVEVKFELVKDADSASGYLWTSVVGEHEPITAGSFCTGSVVIEQKPPIEKVFYKISQWLRSR